MIKRVLWWFAFLALASVVQWEGLAQPAGATPTSPGATQAMVPGAIIAKRVRGNAWRTPQGAKERIPIKENDVLQQGDTVTTELGDSSLVLVFSNGATIQLKPDSTLSVTKYLFQPVAGNIDVANLDEEPSTSDTDVQLVHGELIAKVAKLHTERHSAFIVGTPVGAAGIRGTIFRVVFRPDPVNPTRIQFTVSTAEGQVDVHLQGTITTTAPLPVSGNKEVEVYVDVKKDATTGQVTFSTPVIPEVPVSEMKPETQAAITQATTQVEQAIQNLVITPQQQVAPTTETQGGTGGTQGTGEQSSSEEKKTEDKSTTTQESQQSSETGGTTTTTTTTTSESTSQEGSSSQSTSGTSTGTSTGTSGSTPSTVVTPPPPPAPVPRTTTGDGST